VWRPRAQDHPTAAIRRELFLLFLAAAFLAAETPGPKKYDYFHAVETIDRRRPQTAEISFTMGA
jgi:hypothetical protein